MKSSTPAEIKTIQVQSLDELLKVAESNLSQPRLTEGIDPNSDEFNKKSVERKQHFQEFSQNLILKDLAKTGKSKIHLSLRRSEFPRTKQDEVETFKMDIMIPVPGDPGGALWYRELDDEHAIRIAMARGSLSTSSKELEKIIRECIAVTLTTWEVEAALRQEVDVEEPSDIYLHGLNGVIYDISKPAKEIMMSLKKESEAKLTEMPQSMPDDSSALSEGIHDKQNMRKVSKESKKRDKDENKDIEIDKIQKKIDLYDDNIIKYEDLIINAMDTIENAYFTKGIVLDRDERIEEIYNRYKDDPKNRFKEREFDIACFLWAEKNANNERYPRFQELLNNIEKWNNELRKMKNDLLKELHSEFKLISNLISEHEKNKAMIAKKQKTPEEEKIFFFEIPKKINDLTKTKLMLEKEIRKLGGSVLKGHTIGLIPEEELAISPRQRFKKNLTLQEYRELYKKEREKKGKALEIEAKNIIQLKNENTINTLKQTVKNIGVKNLLNGWEKQYKESPTILLSQLSLLQEILNNEYKNILTQRNSFLAKPKLAQLTEDRLLVNKTIEAIEKKPSISLLSNPPNKAKR
jgi:hypothetical protein